MSNAFTRFYPDTGYPFLRASYHQSPHTNIIYHSPSTRNCSTLQSPPDRNHRLNIMDCYYLLLLIIIFKCIIMCVCYRHKSLYRIIKMSPLFVLFADDTNIFCSNENVEVLQDTLTRELAKLFVWFLINKLSLNLGKTNYMLFRSRPPNLELHLKINNAEIPNVTATKFLGIIIDDRPGSLTSNL